MCADFIEAIDRLDQSGVRYHTLIDSTNEEISGTKTCEALGALPGRIFKSVLFLSHRKLRRCNVLLLPADRKIDLKKAAAIAGAPGRPAGEAEALRFTGFPKGFFGPLCRAPFPVFIDSSAQKWNSIIINAGGRGAYIELSPDDLIKLTGGQFADIAGGWSIEQFARNRTLPLSTEIRHFRITAVIAVCPLEILYQAEDIPTGQTVDICEWFPDRLEYHSVRSADGATVRMLMKDCDSARHYRPNQNEIEDLLRFQNAVLAHGQAMARLAFPKAPAIFAIIPANQTVYTVVEHVEGECLSARIRRAGPMDWATVRTLLYPLMDQIEALGPSGSLLDNIRPDTVLLRENDALLLTYSAPTDSVGSGGGIRFVQNECYDPYIPVSGIFDAVSAFCSVIFYALTGQPYRRFARDASEQICKLTKAGMPASEAKQLLGRMDRGALRREE